MSHDDQELERFRQALTEADPVASLGEPPAAERFWQAARGELPADEARQLLDRTKDDPVAAMAWQLAAEIDTRAGQQSSSRRFTGWWAAAAALLVAVLAPLLLRQSEPTQPTFRGDASGIHSLASSAVPCPRDDCRLTWQGPSELRYRLVILQSDGTPLEDARDLTTRYYELPATLLTPLEAGTVLFWRVEAMTETGLVQSETAAVTLE